MRKLKLFVAMSCIWASSHAIALEPLATLTQAQNPINTLDIGDLNLSAENIAILKMLSVADRDNTVGGSAIWDMLTQNQRLSFSTVTAAYFTVANLYDVSITAARNGTDDAYAKNFLITNLCIGVPITVSRLASSYQIGQARARALERGLVSVSLTDNEISAMLAYSSALFLFSKGCIDGVNAVYPSGRKLQTMDDADELFKFYIDTAYNLKKQWKVVSKDYYFYPGARNKEAQRKLDTLNITNSELAQKFSSMANKQKDIEESMRLIATQEQKYQDCQRTRDIDPGCSVAAARNKALSIARLNGELGSFKTLTLEAHEAQKDMLDLFGINTNYKKVDTGRYEFRFELQ